MKTLFKIFLIFLIFISISLTILNSNITFADETSSILFSSNLDSSTQSPGGNVKFEVFATSKSLTTLSTFRININFDDSKLYYKNIKASDSISSGIFKLKENHGSIAAIYLENKNGLKLESEKLTSLFEITFSIDENIDYDLINISASVDFAVDSDYKPVDSVNSLNQNLIISKPLPANTSLKSLIPSYGNLVPEFDPDITNYYVDVASSVDTITFDATPTDDNSIVKINKKKLGSQGSSTDINITVNAADRSSSTVYTVYVNRLEKSSSESASSSSSSKTSTSSKTSNPSSAKASTSSSSKSSKSSSSSNQSSNMALKANNANKANSKDANSSQNPYTQIGHNLTMRKNSFDIFLLFMLMITCLACAGFLIKKHYIKKKK